MKIVRVVDFADFDATVASTLASAPGAVFVVLFGSAAPETGESWCEDCVIADPLIRSGVRAVPDATLIECPVGQRAEYKNKPQHPYRIHPQIKLTAVPTLIHWTKDGAQSRLVETELASAQNIADWLQKIPASSSS